MTEDGVIREMLAHLNADVVRCSVKRDKAIERVRAFWSGRPRTLLNDQLAYIEIDRYRAEWVLETAATRAEIATIIDCATRMAAPDFVSALLTDDNRDGH